MISIFTTLAFVVVFEILPSKAGPIIDPTQSQFKDAQQTPSNPEEMLDQMKNVINNSPELICAIIDLEPEQVAQMMPRLKELKRILRGNPLGDFFGYMESICTSHADLQEVKLVNQFMEQISQLSAAQSPINIKQKLKFKLVYAPQYNSRSNDGQLPDDQHAKEVAANKMRLAQETTQDLQKLKSDATAAQDQLSQQMVQGSEAIQKRMRESLDATKKEMADAMALMESEKERTFDYMTKAVGWLRQQMEQQMGDLNNELEEKKKFYQAHVEELTSSIRKSFSQENEQVDKDLTEATEEVQKRLTAANTQLDAQVMQARSKMEDEVKKAADDIDAQVKDLHGKMQAVMEDLRKEMENMDTELKQGVTNAADEAKKLAINTSSKAEVEKTIAELKKATEDMRVQMENEIRNAIQGLSAEITSILTEMRNAKNSNEGVQSAPPANSNIQDSPVEQVAGESLEGDQKSLINNNNNTSAKSVEAPTNEKLSTETEKDVENQLDEDGDDLDGDDLDPADLEFDDVDELEDDIFQ